MGPEVAGALVVVEAEVWEVVPVMEAALELGVVQVEVLEEVLEVEVDLAAVLEVAPELGVVLVAVLEEVLAVAVDSAAVEEGALVEGQDMVEALELGVV